MKLKKTERKFSLSNYRTKRVVWIDPVTSNEYIKLDKELKIIKHRK